MLNLHSNFIYCGIALTDDDYMLPTATQSKRVLPLMMLDSDDDESTHAHSTVETSCAAASSVAVDETTSSDEDDKESTLDALQTKRKNYEMVNTFVKMHPMLSSDIFNPTILEKLDEMLERQPIQLRDIPTVDKVYEDGMLRPPEIDKGERPCVLGDECMCVFMSRMKYGPSNPYSFVCTEFLLPEQRREWICGNKLPDVPGKCLVCLRYFTTYLYYMARNDAHFHETTKKFNLQTHQNPTSCSNSNKRVRFSSDSNDMNTPTPSGSFGSSGSSSLSSSCWHDKHLAQQPLPTHCNAVGSANGYRRDAMLFSDEKALQAPSMRTMSCNSIPFHPFVRFCMSHYKYKLVGGKPRLVQMNVGERDSNHARMHLNGQPPSEKVGRTVAKTDVVA